MGRTPTIYNTVHPVWKECFFELPVETLTPEAAAAAPATDEGCRGSVDRRGIGFVGGDGSGAGGNEEKEEGGDKLLLTVQVWDADDGAAADFLGEREFDAQALLEMARGRLKLVRCHSWM